MRPQGGTPAISSPLSASSPCPSTRSYVRSATRQGPPAHLLERHPRVPADALARLAEANRLIRDQDDEDRGHCGESDERVDLQSDRDEGQQDHGRGRPVAVEGADI